MTFLLHLPGYLIVSGMAAFGFGMVAYGAQQGRIFERIRWVSEREQPFRFWSTMFVHFVFGVTALFMLISSLAKDFR